MLEEQIFAPSGVHATTSPLIISQQQLKKVIVNESQKINMISETTMTKFNKSLFIDALSKGLYMIVALRLYDARTASLKIRASKMSMLYV